MSDDRAKLAGGTDRVGKISTTSMILANQFFILGCLVFLVLVQLGHDMRDAGNLLMLVWFGGLLTLISEPLERALNTVYQWWGDRSV